MNPDPSNIELDLDALAPRAAQISLKGKTIEVPALDVPDYAKLIDISADLDNVNKNTPEDATKVIPILEKIKEMIGVLMPELKDEKLNPAQIMAVLNMLITINSPEDKVMKELEKRGIELKKEGNSDPKGLTSPEQSPSSSEPTQATS